MPPRGSKRAVSDDVDVDENDENVPPQGRRSQRVKGRKSASREELGIARVNRFSHLSRTGRTSGWQ